MKCIVLVFINNSDLHVMMIQATEKIREPNKCPLAVVRCVT